MSESLPIDDELVQKLPLPLAKLARRARNSKTPLDRHQDAYFLWEASLKLLGSVAVVEYVELGENDPKLVSLLQNLARPSIGHWWEIVRRLVIVLADTGDAGFVQLRDLLLGRTRDDMPRAAGLHVALIEHQTGARAPARATVRLTELVDRLVAYRNQEIGHGASGLSPASFYDRMARALLRGVTQILQKVDVLAGRKLIYVGEVRRQNSGNWLVDRYELLGESPRRIESLELPENARGPLPLPERVYLERATGHSPASFPRLLSLDPLVRFQLDSEQVFFLNARRNEKHAEFLCYQDGEQLKQDLGTDHRELLARILRIKVDTQEVEKWAARSQAEESSLPEPAHAPEPAHQMIGEYELLSRLGSGGMGVVYRAWQPSLGRQVALKCMLRSGDPKAEARFSREIHALGRVEHPGIVKVFTSGSEADHWFFVMELVEGTDLAQVCDQLTGRNATDVDDTAWRHALSSACAAARSKEVSLGSAEHFARRLARPRGGAPASGETTADDVQASQARGVSASAGYVSEMVDVIRQVAEAAHALHEAGVVHRDIKPGNIMISEESRAPILMDLGLAQIADETDGRLTRTRQFVGTLRYASPEQVLAAGKVDRRSDIYSLGATLWELLALRPLFGATDQTPTPELMLKIQSAEPESPRKYNPHVPRDLEVIVAKCLAKEPSQRYDTAALLADDLGRLLRDEPVHAQPPTLRYVLSKSVRRHKLAIAIAAGTAALLFVGAMFSFVQVSRARDRAVKALANEADARAQVEAFLVREQESNRQLSEQQRALTHRLAENHIHSGIADCLHSQPGLGLSSILAAYEALPADDPLRRSSRLLLAGWEPTLAVRVIHDDAIEAVGFHPSGGLVMTASKDRNVRLWDARTGMPAGEPMMAGSLVWAAAFSPDGKLIATGDDQGSLQIWQTDTQDPRGSPLSHPQAVLSLAFSHDGKLIATGCRDGRVRIWDVASGTIKGTPLVHEKPVFSVAFRPDDHELASGSEDTYLRFWKTSSFQLAGEPIRLDAAVWTVAYSPDGQTLFAGTWSGAGRFYDVKSRLPTHNEIRHNEGILASVFTPDGKQLLVGSRDNTAQFWDVQRGVRIGETYEHLRSIRAVALSRTGKDFMTGSRDCVARVFHDNNPQSTGRAFKNASAVLAIAVSPDGNHLVAGCRDGVARVWDIATGRPAGPDLKHDGPVTAASFTADGRTIVTASEDGMLRLWNRDALESVATPIRCGAAVTSLGLFPDETMALVGSLKRSAQILDLTSGQACGKPLAYDAAVRAVAVVPGGKQIVTGGIDKTIRIWDRTTGQPVGKPMTHNDPVLALAVDTSGRFLVSGSADNTARLWDIASQVLLQEMTGHDRDVVSVAISPDGQLILTGSDDLTTRLWDAYTGKPAAEKIVHDSAVHAVAFSPRGDRSYVARDSGIVDEWPVPKPLPDEPQRVAAWIRARTSWTVDERGIHRRLKVNEWTREWKTVLDLGGPLPLWYER
jgi:WD40 repeat protein/serine/threonine protein kinase